MNLIVQKFGGTSVANAERVRHVAQIITDTYEKGNAVIAVVSAQGDTTDDLIEKAKDENVPAVLKMELSNADIANAVAEASGTEVRIFYSCHNLSAEDFEKGETYLTMMQKNADTLKEVLN